MVRRRVAAFGAVAALSFAGGHAVADPSRPGPDEVVYNLPPGADGAVDPDPLLATGVGVGKDVAVYTASGTGPAALNPLAPTGSSESYIDYALLAQLHPAFAPTDAEKAVGALPPGVTITEAQGLNAMARVQENLVSVGLTLAHVLSMRIYQDNPPGSAVADFAGWNRAYRKYMANVDRVTGQALAAYAPVIFENPTRPARANVEVASLPRPGWLIEIELTAAFPR